jgi:hypothetical protein
MSVDTSIKRSAQGIEVFMRRSLSRSPRNMVVAALIVGIVCGCSASSPTGSSPSSLPISRATPSSGTTSLATSSNTMSGPSVMVQDGQGFRFRVSTSPLKLVVQVDLPNGGTAIAPPGQNYLTFVLHVANAMTDRPEVFSAYSIELVAPKADIAAITPDHVANWGCAYADLPQGSCSSSYLEAVYSVAFTNRQEIQVGSSVDVPIFLSDPVLSTAPLADMSVNWQTTTVDGAATKQTLVVIPIVGH